MKRKRLIGTIIGNTTEDVYVVLSENLGVKSFDINAFAGLRVGQGVKVSITMETEPGKISFLIEEGIKEDLCVCTKECDCENPPTEENGEGVHHVSEYCPIHNHNPKPLPECPIHGE